MPKRCCCGVVFTLILVLFSSSGTGKKYEKKIISNKLYSISVPSDWQYQGKEEDGTVPSEREVRQYHLYYLRWGIPIKRETAHNLMGINIESYRKTDNTPISIEEVEKSQLRFLKTIALEYKEISTNKKDYKKMMFFQESKDVFGKTERLYCFILLCKSGDLVHLLTLAVAENRYKQQGTQEIMDDILDSFSTK